MFCRYYLGIDEEKPGERHLYTVRNPRKGGRGLTSPLGNSKATSPICLTCHHRHAGPYENCTYFTAYLPPPPYISKWGLLTCLRNEIARKVSFLPVIIILSIYNCSSRYNLLQGITCWIYFGGKEINPPRCTLYLPLSPGNSCGYRSFSWRTNVVI